MSRLRQRFEVELDGDEPTLWEAVDLIELFSRLLELEPPPLHVVGGKIRITRIG